MATYQLPDRLGPNRRPPNGCVRLVLADPDPLARTAVREGIAKMSDLAVVTEAADCDDATSAIVEHSPDVILVDTQLPPDGAIRALVEFLALDPAIHVVVFAMHADDQLALRALEAGASGFLPKDIDMSALGRALAKVARGEAAVSRPLSQLMILRLRTLAARVRDMRPVSSPLTDRQWEVLGLLSDGRSLTEISELLHVSLDTARGHVRMVLRGLGAETPTEAVYLAEYLRTGSRPEPIRES